MKVSSGLTLVELMVTLSVAAVMATLAVPAFSTFVTNNRITSQVHDIISSINLARSEALKRGNRVTLCKSADGNLCSNSGQWQQGWIIFEDLDDNGVRNAANETLLYVQTELHQLLTLDGSGELDSYISLSPTGFTQQKNSQAALSGDLILCDQRGFGQQARVINISVTGNVQSLSATDDNVSAHVKSISDCTI